MVRINLLPWREQARKAKRIRFGILLGIFLLFTLFIIICAHIYVDSLIAAQQERLDYLQSEIDLEQGTLGTLKVENKKKLSLESQLGFVMNLRARGLQAIHLFDALTNSIPSALTLEKIERQGNIINLTGKAQSDMEITLFMKNLFNQHYFNQPVLTDISTRKNGNVEERYFHLKLVQQE